MPATLFHNHILIFTLTLFYLPYIMGIPLLGEPALRTTPNSNSLALSAIPEQKNVIVQLFQWNWNSIAKECTEFIGPAGYGYVQVSPPAEHIQGPEWWTDYQPVSYKLISKRGNRQQFAAMVSACKAAGVKVIVDTLFNHMSAKESGSGTGGSSLTHYNYPGLYSIDDFHACRKGISDYSNRTEVQTCELLGLADLATETEHVRAQLANYALDLRMLGVSGFRLDAAKRKSHINAADIANILSRVPGPFYVTQEVTTDAKSEAVKPSEYTMNGAVQVFDYTRALKEAFSSGKIASLGNLNTGGWVPSDKANVFVANHDTERSGESLNANSASNTYTLAMIFSLAHPYGLSPTILSSYASASKDAGAPNGGEGQCTENGGSRTNGWLCQHRWQAVAGMVQFKNVVGGSEMKDWVSPDDRQIAFGRGSLGFVAINTVNTSWVMSFSTSMPDGEYCDIIAGSCNDGSKIQVSGGKFSTTVPARGAIAIHVFSKPLSPSSTPPLGTSRERVANGLGS